MVQYGFEHLLVEENATGSASGTGFNAGNSYTQSGMDELMALQRCTPCQALPFPSVLTSITTPLRLEAWEQALSTHPDRRFVEFLFRGIAKGFRIGYDYRHHFCKPARSNMKSAKEMLP